MPYDDFAHEVRVHYGDEPEPPRSRPPIRWRRHLILTALTLLMMKLGHDWKFPLVLFLILLAHEMGHYVACRIYDVDASPPYFLPGLPAILGSDFFPGTFGAFIRIREQIPTRRALFDIGIAGPIAGFVVVLIFLPAAILEIQPIPEQQLSELGAGLSNPLLFHYLVPLMRGFPDSTPYSAGPVFIAVWWGCLATMLNLLPIGQLDGGHVAYAVFGKRYNRIAPVFLAMLWGLVIYTRGSFLLMAGLVTLLGARHPPLQSEQTGIGWPRRLLAVAALGILVACFHPLLQIETERARTPERPRVPHGRSGDFARREAAPAPGPAPANEDAIAGGAPLLPLERRLALLQERPGPLPHVRAGREERE